MTTYTTKAICLKSYDYSDSSKILNFYSPESGLIRAIAKGAKRQKSKLAGACELLNLSELQFISGRNLDVLCQYQPVEAFSGIRSDIVKLAFALLFAELVNGVAAEQDMDCGYIYGLLIETLRELDEPSSQIQDEFGDQWPLVIGVDFHMRLLEAVGYAPVVEHCMLTGDAVDWGRRYYPFSADLGGVVTGRPADGETGALVNVSTSTLKVLKEPRGGGWAEAQPLKVLKFLQYYFSYKIERRLKAYDFVFQVSEGMWEAQKSLH